MPKSHFLAKVAAHVMQPGAANDVDWLRFLFLASRRPEKKLLIDQTSPKQNFERKTKQFFEQPSVEGIYSEPRTRKVNNGQILMVSAQRKGFYLFESFKGGGSQRLQCHWKKMS